MYFFAINRRRPSRPFGGGGVLRIRYACFLPRRRGAAVAYLTSAADRSGRIARPLRVRIGAFMLYPAASRHRLFSELARGVKFPISVALDLL